MENYLGIEMVNGYGMEDIIAICFGINLIK
jgi:hypothetical protein